MTMRVTWIDGSTEIIAEAVSVDTKNFHEGMFDFYDALGNLLRQIDMHEDITWELVTEASGSITVTTVIE